MMPVHWLGRVPYREALRWQHLRRRGIATGAAPDVLWMLEHSPVVTLGRRGGLSEDVRDLEGVPVERTRRGGLATYHGPGQLVGYLLCDLSVPGWTVKGVVHGLEDGIVTWLEGRGVRANTRGDAPGVWVGDDKICAVGLHVRRKVTMHGFALNLQTDLSGFEGFVPCGLAGLGVTSLERLERAAPTPCEAADEVGQAVLQGIVGRHL